MTLRDHIINHFRINYVLTDCDLETYIESCRLYPNEIVIDDLIDSGMLFEAKQGDFTIYFDGSKSITLRGKNYVTGIGR